VTSQKDQAQQTKRSVNGESASESSETPTGPQPLRSGAAAQPAVREEHAMLALSLRGGA
jgi:hypothetical protein